jgi:hypothetical protein
MNGLPAPSTNNIQKPSINLKTFDYDAPLLMYQPFNIVVLLTLYSPIIVTLGVLSMSFIFQNFKGFIYLGFLLAASVLREFLLMIFGAKQQVSANKICNSVEYSKYVNSGFSVFVLSFTVLYICLPMFLNNDVNYLIFGGLLTYLLIDIFIRYTKECITTYTDILLNVATGAFSGAIIPGMLYVGGSSKYLFFNEISSNKEICSMPKKQQFKCNVYKNGELIASK